MIDNALDIINRACTAHSASVAYSGGGDSTVLLHLVSQTPHRPPVYWANNGLQPPGTRDFVGRVADNWGFELREVDASPESWPEYWKKSGWPFLGKIAGANWTRKYGEKLGFRCGISSCCSRHKIRPVRRQMKADGADCQIVGTKAIDDNTRSYRAAMDDGAITTLATGVHVAKPLTGWTDLMIRRYTRENDLPAHPWKARGGNEVGCILCGGGAQYEDSPYAVLRRLEPDRWKQFIVDWGAGEIITALRHGWTLKRAKKALANAGGLAQLAETRPELFDYIRIRPLKERHKKN